MVRKEVIFCSAIVLLVLFSLSFVFSAITNTPTSLNLGYNSGSYLFNITINNTNGGQAANVTQINVTLDDNFSFITGSNGTNTPRETLINTSNVLSWTNATYLINGTVNNSYFWFSASFSSDIPLGNYNFTIIALNGSGANQLTNLSITILDLVNPLVTVDFPPSGTNYSQTSINFNISASDEKQNVSDCNYTLNSGTTNYTMSSSAANIWNATNSTIADGLYTAKFYCWDTSNNFNGTSQSTFIIDRTPPFVRINYPTNGLNLSSRVIQINVTVNDTHESIVGVGLNFANITLYNASNSIMNSTINSTQGNSSTFLTIPSTASDGIYTVNVTAYDLLTQQNSTTINVIMDTQGPVITVYSPLNDTNYYANQSVIVHFMRSDLTAGSMWYNFNETTNITYSGSVSVNYTSTGIKNIIFYSNDSFNNVTTLRYVVNITSPLPSVYFLANETAFAPNSTQTVLVVPYNSTLQNVTLSNESQAFSLDLSQIKLSGGIVSTVNNFTLTTTGTYNYTVYIPSGINITGGSDWTGMINLPTRNISTFTTPAFSGNTTAQDAVIDVGSSLRLNFSSPVKIIISGLGGKRAAWATAGSTVLNDISTVCNSTTTPTNVPSDGECYNSSGSDLVIWTYHFTTFAAYTSTPIPASIVSSEGSSGSYIQAVGSSEIDKGITKYLQVTAQFKFMLLNETHYLTLNSINNTSKTASVTISSNPQTFTLLEGETRKINLNSDNYYDLEVKLSKVISAFGANIYLHKISEEIPAVPASEEKKTATEKVAEAVSNAVESTKSILKSVSLWAVVLAIVLVLVVLVVLLRKKKRYYKKGY